MKKSLLIAAAAATLLTATGASVASHGRWPTGVLYDQNSNFGVGINSQNYTTGFSSYDDTGADDFAVPAGHTWTITGVDVTGAYSNGSGPASSVTITFWTDKGHPAKIARRGADTFTFTTCTDNAGSFSCPIGKNLRGKPVRLGGRAYGKGYYITVVANCGLNSCGEWNWTTNTTVHNGPAFWQNPGGG